MSDMQVHYPIVRCVVMGSDSATDFNQVQDAMVSTIKNIQSFYEEKIHIQFVFPCNYTREGWAPMRGVAERIATLSNGWIDQWFDSNVPYAPMIHPIYTMVEDRAVTRSTLSREPMALDKNEIDSIFRLETSFGVPTVSPFKHWAATVFYPQMWDMFINMSHESESFQAAPEFALTIHVNGLDDQTLLLEDEAVKAGATVYSFNHSAGSTRSRLI